MISSSTEYGSKSTNGWLLAVLEFTARTYGWSLQYIKDEVSLLSLMLLMRQKKFADNGKGITLADKEMIDNMDFDKLLEQQRMRFKPIVRP